MNPLGSTLSALSAGLDLARAAASPAEAGGAAPPVRPALETAVALERARAKSGASARLASSPPRRRGTSRARGRSAVAGWARPGSAKSAVSRAPVPKGGAAGPAASRSSAAKSGGAASDPLAFLHDPKLSIEEKLMRLLAHLNAGWEKDMQKKLDEMAGHRSTSGAKSSQGSSSKSTSFLGKIVDGAKKFFPAAGIALDALKNPAVRAIATKIGGPVLAAGATALGFPALAPALLKYAPTVIDLVGGAVSSLDTGSAAAGKSSRSDSGASAADGNGGGLSDSDRQLKIMELQRIQEKQKEMFALVSNILRSGHDLRMSIVGNIR